MLKIQARNHPGGHCHPLIFVNHFVEFGCACVLTILKVVLHHTKGCGIFFAKILNLNDAAMMKVYPNYLVSCSCLYQELWGPCALSGVEDDMRG